MELVTKRDMEDAKALIERQGADIEGMGEFLHDIAQSIADGRRADLLPWDAGANRHYEPVEQLAKEIYGDFQYDGPGSKPTWMQNGNSTKQDDARHLARAKLRATGHKGPSEHG